MTTAGMIDGRAIATGVREKIRAHIGGLIAAGQRPPCMTLVLVGELEESQGYIALKEKAASAVGIKSAIMRLPARVAQHDVLKTIDDLNNDHETDAILVQLPLPSHLDKFEIIDRIAPEKDIDGLTTFNQGRLALGLAGLYPCTPLGIMEILRAERIAIAGRIAAVVGQSTLVGASVSKMLVQQNATVISIRKATPNPAELTRQADIVVVATGHEKLVDASWIKPGACVIDVGMHYHGKNVTGDVDAESVKRVAGRLTQVPGGVGPMTVAMLLANCLQARTGRPWDA